jgi:hypothetical protein
VPRRIVPSLIALAMVTLACSGGPAPSMAVPTSAGASVSAPAGDLVPVLVSSEVAVGENRLLFNLVDGSNRVLSAPDVAVDLRFEAATDAECAPQETEGHYIDVGEETGLYRTSVSFDCAGDWTAEITAHLDAGERTAAVRFPVHEASSTPGVGEDVPATDNPTAATTEEIALVSTDDDPDPDFYGSTPAELLADGTPFVIVFATPAFCRTRACGPTLDIVKQAAAGFRDGLAFIHVEPYALEMRDGVLQPVLSETGDLQPVESVVEWGLLSEPYTFVVGADGRLTAKFEGVASEDELVEAFEAVAKS